MRPHCKVQVAAPRLPPAKAGLSSTKKVSYPTTLTPVRRCKDPGEAEEETGGAAAAAA